jgi:hypothetical protein
MDESEQLIYDELLACELLRGYLIRKAKKERVPALLHTLRKFVRRTLTPTVVELVFVSSNDLCQINRLTREYGGRYGMAGGIDIGNLLYIA